MSQTRRNSFVKPCQAAGHKLFHQLDRNWRWAEAQIKSDISCYNGQTGAEMSEEKHIEDPKSVNISHSKNFFFLFLHI